MVCQPSQRFIHINIQSFVMLSGEYKIGRTQFGPLLLKIVYSHFGFLWTKLLQQQKDHGCFCSVPSYPSPYFYMLATAPSVSYLLQSVALFHIEFTAIYHCLHISLRIDVFFFIFPLIYQSYFFWYTYICKVQVSFTTVIGSVTFLCNFHVCRQLVDHRKSNLSTGLRSSCFLNVSLAPEVF